MAMVDEYDILSDKQTIDATCWTDRCKHIGAPHDFGAMGGPIFCALLAHANCNLGTHLTFKLFGYNDLKEATDAKEIATSLTIKTADIKPGFRTFIQIPPTGLKYSYIAGKYIVDDGSGVSETPTNIDYCPQVPLRDETKYPENTFSAYLTDAAPIDISYAFANAEKSSN